MFLLKHALFHLVISLGRVFWAWGGRLASGSGRLRSFRFPALAILLYVDQAPLPTGQWFAVSPAVSMRESWLTPRRRAKTRMTQTFPHPKPPASGRKSTLHHHTPLCAFTQGVSSGLLPSSCFILGAAYPWDCNPTAEPASPGVRRPLNIPHTKHANSRATAVTATLCFTPRRVRR